MSHKAGRPQRFGFVTDELPRPGAAGHLAYNHALISHLASRGHRVDLFLTRPRLPLPVMRTLRAAPYGSISGPRLLKASGFMVAAEPRAALASLARAVLPAAIRHHRRHADVVLGATITNAEADWIARRIINDPPDALLIDTMFRAPLLDCPSLSHLKSVIVTHDLFHRRHAALSLAGYRVEPAILTRQSEAASLARADALVAIQPEEAALLAQMCPTSTIITVPMPAEPRPRPAGTTRDADRLVFIGSDNLPNLDGLRWFFEAVWPDLRTARPHLTLDLAGDCGTAIGATPQGVSKLGRLANLAPILHRAGLAIAPLRAGSGLKVKLLDYARHGLWTVATTQASAGLAADGNQPLFIADIHASFATTIVAALSQPRDDTTALNYIVRHYAPNHIFTPLTDLLEG